MVNTAAAFQKIAPTSKQKLQHICFTDVKCAEYQVPQRFLESLWYLPVILSSSSRTACLIHFFFLRDTMTLLLWASQLCVLTPTTSAEGRCTPKTTTVELAKPSPTSPSPSAFQSTRLELELSPTQTYFKNHTKSYLCDREDLVSPAGNPPLACLSCGWALNTSFLQNAQSPSCLSFTTRLTSGGAGASAVILNSLWYQPK